MHPPKSREDSGPFSRRTKVDLSVAVLGGMAAWVFHLAASYLLVPFVCGTDRPGLLHAVTGAAALLAAAATWRGWRLRARLRSAPASSGSSDAVLGFLAAFGLAASGFFLMLILIEGLPAALQSDPCVLVPTLDRPIILEGSSEEGLRALALLGAIRGNPNQGDAKMTESRDEYVKKLEQKLEEWNMGMDELQSRVDRAEAEAGQHADPRIERVRERYNAARERMAEIQASGPDEWSRHREGMEEARRLLDEALEDARGDQED